MTSGKKMDSDNVTVIANDIKKDGTEILIDGNFGNDKGKVWVGWSMSPYIDITFEFSPVKKFKDVTLTVNVDKKRSYALFKRSQIFFALTKDNFTSTLQYCLRNFTDNATQSYSTNITLPLCGNSAEFIKLRLYFGGRWLLISEISFNSGTWLHYFSMAEYTCLFFYFKPFVGNNFTLNVVSYIIVPVSGNKNASLPGCMGDACIVARSSIATSRIEFCSTSSPECDGRYLNYSLV